MAGDVRTLLRLWGIHGRMDLLWLFRDTKYCLLQIFSDIVSTASVVCAVYLLSERVGGVGGMTREEMLFMLAYGVTVEGLYIIMFVNGNTGQLSRIIGRGHLDHNILQPTPLWMQFITQGFAPFSGNGPLLCGVFLMFLASSRMNLSFSAYEVTLVVLSLLCSCAVMVCTISLVSCSAFYTPEATEEIAEEVLHLFAGTRVFPLGMFSPIWQAALCLVVPIGLVAWFPSQLITGGVCASRGLAIVAYICVTGVFVLLFALMFRKGYRHYATYGSPRYSGFGHR